MAVVKGVKEQVHLPLYDSIFVQPKQTLGSILTSNVLKFFVDVNGKTKLLTNMQAASLLPHWNTFEARALRVVISDLCPQFSDTLVKLTLTGCCKYPESTSKAKQAKSTAIETHPLECPKVTLSNVNLQSFINLVRNRACHDLPIEVDNADLECLGITASPELDDGQKLRIDSTVLKTAEITTNNGNGQRVCLPLPEQVFPCNGCGNVISKIIYNTVTTFFVGEKIMIQVPTWFFPAGAGPYSEDGGTITHGYPSPQATFRFAEPVVIDTQQNFRVEIEVPENNVFRELQCVYGPLFIWVVLDGYMTRDVQ